MLKLLLLLRYLTRKKIVLLSIAAVALACALLIVVASIFGGFIRGIEKATAQVYGDVYLDPGQVIQDHQLLVEHLESIPNVRAATAVLNTHGLLHLGRGNVKAVRVSGIDPRTYNNVAQLSDSLLLRRQQNSMDKLIDASGPSRIGFVGIGLLAEPDADTDLYDMQSIRQSWLNESVVLATGTATDSGSQSDQPSGIRTRYTQFDIADISFTGIYFRDNQDVYLPFETVRQLVNAATGAAGANETFHIALEPGTDPESMIPAIQQSWQEFAAEHVPDSFTARPFVRTASQMTASIVVELQKQMAVLMLIFGVLSSAAILLIFCIFYMIVMTKRRDIGIIKSCGMSRFSVASIFLAFGLCLGLVGSALGLVLGTIVTHNINVVENLLSSIFGFKIWKSSVYVFESIPNQVNMAAALWIMLFAVAAAVLGVLVPAIIAARTQAVNILRYE